METKKFMIIFKLNLRTRMETRTRYIEARSSLEAVTLYFKNCPYTERFELISCIEVEDRFIEYHKIHN